MRPLIQYKPPGPVAAAFHASNAFVRGLLGPVGSGKSSSCCAEILSRALEQKPYNGVRRSRWIVTRNTYPELKSTTIKTWNDWFGEIGTIKWDAPITGTYRIDNVGDGTKLDLEVIFLALDRPDDVGKLKSLEATGVWMNEASEQPKWVLDMATQRVGRYPPKRWGGPSWAGVIMDTNPPDDDHWWYKLAEETKPESFEFFKQPGGLYRDQDPASPTFGQLLNNPDAENVANLPGGYDYYRRQIDGKSDDYINVYLLAQYGTTLDGKPVYPEWRDSFHVSPTTLHPTPGYPILMALDFGLTPACVFMQLGPTGQLVVLRELVSEDMGIRQFYSDVILPFRNSNFPGFRFEMVGDPAGRNRSQNDAKSCFEELASMGAACEGASTNEFTARREAVAFWLNRVSGGRPAFLLDPSCRVLRKGFNGGYRYERVKVGGEERFRDRPVKDKYSHPHDALQYGCLRMRGDINPVRARPVKHKSTRAWT